MSNHNNHALLRATVAAEVAAASSKGPYGHFPKGPLSTEDAPGPTWKMSEAGRQALGARLGAQDLEGALHLVKVALSFDFFNPHNLYLAFALSCQLDNAQEGLEFLRQALIIAPENEEYRSLYVQFTGGPFINPVH